MNAQQVRPAQKLLAVAVSGLVCSLAQAQQASSSQSPDTSDNQVPEIVVTAQRTSALASRTPVAMSVLTGEQLRELGADNPAAIGPILPNVHIDQAFSGLRVTIRGISNNDTTDKGDPSAAFMVDGVYIARPAGQGANFLDVDRIEVLRGPQGTLYGRNTTAGLVHVISNAPTNRLEGAAGVEFGSYDNRKLDGMLNVPVNDALALRAAVSVRRQDPFLNNGQGTPYRAGMDRDDRDARLGAKLAMGEATLLVRYDHSEVANNNDRIVPDTNFYTGIAAGAPVWRGSGSADTDARLTNGFRPPNIAPVQGMQERRARGLAADLSWNLGPATVYYLASHRELDQQLVNNYYYRLTPALALGVINTYDGANRQDSHELRIATNGAGALAAQGGLYYFTEESDTSYAFQGLRSVGLPPYYAFPLVTEARSRAMFGQLTWRVRDGLRLTAGARRTLDRKGRLGSTDFQQGPVFNPATDRRLLNAAELSTARTTWRLGAEFDLAPATLAYLSLATGYKAGAFNDGCVAGTTALGIACPAAAAVTPEFLYYQPEQLRAWEAGLKSRLLGGRLAVNAAVFNYDYTNLQLTGNAIVAGAPRLLTRNAGAARSRGVELDGELRVGSGGRLAYGLTLLDAHYVRYMATPAVSWAGRKLDRAPSHVLTLGYSQRVAVAGGQLTGGVFARASGEYVIAVPSQLLTYRVPSHTSTDATLGWQPQAARWSLLARVRNIEGKVRPAIIDSFGMTTPTAPRTADLRLDLRF
ncbi:TonB-dependent receptor [Massilia yuzhufengensis]|uniref:Iron complex outermembrane recepter protein n=1 Tax=Massilia yuzhufengensis TaxID=1164594 RepID=A0A1I1UNW0_9BURK|nr:TonB-dependent receptor [Massilia yuzhufengensis]SFD71318.1 iron complex outermembrane recepter protein [Massilia yuzhufengensis]